MIPLSFETFFNKRVLLLFFVLIFSSFSLAETGIGNNNNNTPSNNNQGSNNCDLGNQFHKLSNNERSDSIVNTFIGAATVATSCYGPNPDRAQCAIGWLQTAAGVTLLLESRKNRNKIRKLGLQDGGCGGPGNGGPNCQLNPDDARCTACDINEESDACFCSRSENTDHDRCNTSACEENEDSQDCICERDPDADGCPDNGHCADHESSDRPDCAIKPPPECEENPSTCDPLGDPICNIETENCEPGTCAPSDVECLIRKCEQMGRRECERRISHPINNPPPGTPKPGSKDSIITDGKEIKYPYGKQQFEEAGFSPEEVDSAFDSANALKSQLKKLSFPGESEASSSFDKSQSSRSELTKGQGGFSSSQGSSKSDNKDGDSAFLRRLQSVSKNKKLKLKTKKYGNDKIGAAQENIFEMISRSYKSLEKSGKTL